MPGQGIRRGAPDAFDFEGDGEQARAWLDTAYGASLGLGGAALVVCDLVSRAAFRFLHTEPPVGAVTALIGGTLFLLLLRRHPGRR